YTPHIPSSPTLLSSDLEIDEVGEPAQVNEREAPGHARDRPAPLVPGLRAGSSGSAGWRRSAGPRSASAGNIRVERLGTHVARSRSEEHTSELQSPDHIL